MLYQWDVTLPSLSGSTPRRAYLYLPRIYEEEPEARFPVLYMFDGQNVFLDADASFGKSWCMYDYMNATETPLIIAAVSSGENRLAEYSPFSYDEPELGRIRARGRTYMEWLLGEFKPMIDENVRTLPDRENTLIAGSSMGGLMSLYAVLNYNECFQRAACLSPSLWVHPKKSLRMIEKSNVAPDTCIYLDYGSEEIGNHRQNPAVLNDACGALLRHRVDLTFRIVPGGTHSEASWEQQVPIMMKCLGF